MLIQQLIPGFKGHTAVIFSKLKNCDTVIFAIINQDSSDFLGFRANMVSVREALGRRNHK